MANWPTGRAAGGAKGLVGKWRRVAARAGFITTSMRLPGRRRTAKPVMHERTPGRYPLRICSLRDVCVPAVLGEFAQDVEVHPAQRERAPPVAVDPVL